MALHHATIGLAQKGGKLTSLYSMKTRYRQLFSNRNFYLSTNHPDFPAFQAEIYPNLLDPFKLPRFILMPNHATDRVETLLVSRSLADDSLSEDLAEVLGTALGTVMGAEVIWMSTSGKNTPKSSATKEIFVSSGACNKEM
jgi:hypothetical protein